MCGDHMNMSATLLDSMDIMTCWIPTSEELQESEDMALVEVWWGHVLYCSLASHMSIYGVFRPSY